MEDIMIKSTLKTLTLVSIAGAMLVGSNAQAMLPALANVAKQSTRVLVPAIKRTAISNARITGDLYKAFQDHAKHYALDHAATRKQYEDKLAFDKARNKFKQAMHDHINAQLKYCVKDPLCRFMIEDAIQLLIALNK
jgi:hypothetical protein